MQGKRFMRLRFIFGFSFIVIAVVTGILGRSPFMIMPLAALFLVANLSGDWPTWRLRFKTMSKTTLLKLIFKNYLSLIIVVAILNIFGLGLGLIFSVAPLQMSLTSTDIVILLCSALYLALGITLFALIDRTKTLEIGPTGLSGGVRGTNDILDDVFEVDDNNVPVATMEDEGSVLLAPNPDPDPDLIMSPEPITPETFYSGRHWGVSNHAAWALQHWPDEKFTPV